MNASWTRTLTRLATAALLLLPVSTVFGQERDEYGEEAQTVARISHLQGSASYARGDQPDDWQPADVNVPMTIGDRVYTDRRTRLELQLEGGGAIRLGGQTDLVTLNLTDDTKQFALKAGVASFQVARLDRDDVFEVDTPNAAVTFESPGDYRFDIDQDGNTRVSVRRGQASVAAGGGEVPLRAGDAMLLDGGDTPRYDVVAMRTADGWDSWVDDREGRYTRAQSYQYVSHDIAGADDLDDYGRWQQVPQYGMAWSPSTVEAGWSPYRVGHWAWQDPWGWTWISSEPWGWAPYHYGRWVTYSSRWFWVPTAAAVARVAYAPACVAFVGGTPGFSATVAVGGPGFVGWFPLAPHEALIPWWRPQPAVQVNVTNVTYVNRTYVTVVNQNTFVSSQAVNRSIVTDRTVVQQVAAAPVVRTVPVMPTVQSTRVSLRPQTAVARPSAVVASRTVVARVAPPPAQPRFDQKLAVIRENKAPVAPKQAAQLTASSPRSTAPVPVRPATSESGRVTFAPRAVGTTAGGAAAGVATAARPAPTPRPATAASAGRQLSTREQPVATAPVNGPRRAAPAEPAREAQAPPSRPEDSRSAPPAQRPEAETRSTQPQAQPQPVPARPEAESRSAQPAVPPARPVEAPDSRMLRPTPVRPPVDTRDGAPDRPEVQTREPQSPSERAQPAAPPARRVVTPPDRSNENRSNENPQASRPQNDTRAVNPRRSVPTARPDVDERSRQESQAPPPRNIRGQPVQAPPTAREQSQPSERVAPSDRNSATARAQQQSGHRPTPPRPRPTPNRDADKPDR